jgi:hypothetical protein
VTFALVVSTVGDAPVTVTFSAMVATFMPEIDRRRLTDEHDDVLAVYVWNPDNSNLIRLGAGNEGREPIHPPASVTPTIEPATSTGLLIVIVTPGTMRLDRPSPGPECCRSALARPRAPRSRRRAATLPQLTIRFMPFLLVDESRW